VTNRRGFLAYVLGAIAAPLLAQRADLQNGKAIVCDEDVLTCPNGHKTCRNIDAPIVVGSDRNVDNPDVAELHNYHMERCNFCRVLFTRE
jgi:hypothetical protein